MKSSRSLRSTAKVDYKMLAEGELADSESETGEQFSPPKAAISAKPKSEVKEVKNEIDDLRRQMLEEEERQKTLREDIEMSDLKEKLAQLRLENEELARRKRGERPHSAKPAASSRRQAAHNDQPEDLTLDQLRKKENLTRKVDRELAKLQLWRSDESESDSPSGHSSDEKPPSSRPKDRKNKSKGMQSGRAAKPSSAVLYPQLWPHSELNTSFVDVNICYDNLSIDEFVAGYSTILQGCRPESREFKARLGHLVSLMYLAGRYEWKAVLSFHGAVLLDIERGRACWGDNFSYLEARTLHGYLKDRNNGEGSSKGSGNVFFCREYQKGKCRSSRDHSGTIRGETRFLRHICAACWLKTRSQQSHPETSPDCPFYKPVVNKD